MELWLLLLYAVASFLALRSLVSLMTHHKRVYAGQYLAEELARRKREKAGRQADGNPSEEELARTPAAAQSEHGLQSPDASQTARAA
ncbi:MAG: hypothetical protein GXP27_05575 [Planctomycetes bacterium]|nr:hypothetical protein [Planctomycetota bacterium]